MADRKALEELETWLHEIDPNSDPSHVPVNVKLGKLVNGGSFAGFELNVGPWWVTGKARIADGQLAIFELSIAPSPFELQSDRQMVSPASGVTSSVMREIPIGAILASIRRELMALPEIGKLGEKLGYPIRSSVEAAKAFGVDGNTKVGPGRKPQSDEELHEFALMALRLQSEDVKSLRRSLADELGMPADTVRDWMRRARDRGFLASVSQGQRGVMPGPRLLVEGSGVGDD